jgi:NDP-sugar pyrophosphorylase family protein
MVNNEFYGYVINEAFIDIGMPGRYKEANNILPKIGFLNNKLCKV